MPSEQLPSIAVAATLGPLPLWTHLVCAVQPWDSDTGFLCLVFTAQHFGGLSTLSHMVGVHSFSCCNSIPLQLNNTLLDVETTNCFSV